MQSTVFQHAYLLQSIAWAIAHSFWQAASLWLLYQIITAADKKLPGLVKHHLSIAFTFTAFIWFIVTIAQNYHSLANAAAPGMIHSEGLIVTLLPLNNALPFISIAYLALLSYNSWLFFKNLSANRFLQTSGLSKAPLHFRLFAERIALHIGIKKKVKVWLSEHVDVPSVTGFLKPVILLPAAIINHLSIQQTEAILLHELAHIKRNDYLINVLQSLAELVLFFNPFAILLSKAAKKERENCCDDWVMNFQYDRREYARALLVLEEHRQLLQPRFALCATNGKKNLLQRVKRLFSATARTSLNSFQKLKLALLFFLLFASVLALIPLMANKKTNEKALAYDKNEKPDLVKFASMLPVENAVKNIMASPVIKLVNKKVRPQLKTKNKKELRVEPAREYVNAYINEELINPLVEAAPIAARAADQAEKNLKYLLKIEEQQSGKKQTNTYYFELKSKDGKPDIKPLLMLNKFKIPAKKIVFGKLQDSLKTLKILLKNKRITT